MNLHCFDIYNSPDTLRLLLFCIPLNHNIYPQTLHSFSNIYIVSLGLNIHWFLLFFKYLTWVYRFFLTVWFDSVKKEFSSVATFVSNNLKFLTLICITFLKIEIENYKKDATNTFKIDYENIYKSLKVKLEYVK